MAAVNYLSPSSTVEMENRIMEEVQCMPKVVAQIIASYVLYRFNFENLNGASAPDEVHQCLTLLRRVSSSMEYYPFRMEGGSTIEAVQAGTPNSEMPTSIAKEHGKTAVQGNYWFIASRSVFLGSKYQGRKGAADYIRNLNESVAKEDESDFFKRYPLQRPKSIEITRAIQVANLAGIRVYDGLYEATFCDEDVGKHKMIVYRNSQGGSTVDKHDTYWLHTQMNSFDIPGVGVVIRFPCGTQTPSQSPKPGTAAQVKSTASIDE